MAETNIPVVGMKRAAECVEASIITRTPLMLLGPPGVGKTALVKQAAAKHGMQFLALRLVQIEAVDLRGMPYPKKDESGNVVSMGFAVPELLPQDGTGVLFLDEFGQASHIVQNAASELLDERRCGDYRLPDGWVVVAASNRRGDRAASSEIPTHLRNRVFQVEIKPDYSEWRDWAVETNIDPRLIAFLGVRSELLHKFDPDAQAFPSPRSWEYASRILQSGVPDEVQRTMVSGAVGWGAANELFQTIDRMINLPSLEDILKDPEGIALPKKASQTMAMASLVTEGMTADNAAGAVRFLGRIAKETVRGKVSLALAKKPGLWDIPEVAEFAASIGERRPGKKPA